MTGMIVADLSSLFWCSMKDPGTCNQPGEADGHVVLDIDVKMDMHWHYVGHSAGYVTHRSRRRYISSVPLLHMDIRGLR